MFALSFEEGMDTVSCCALFALRTRDSMSAIGSVMVIASDRFPFSLRFPHLAHLTLLKVAFSVWSIGGYLTLPRAQ